MRLNKKNMKYPTMDSLNHIVNVLNETAIALENADRISLSNGISKVGVGFGSGILMTGISYKLLGILGIKGYSAAGITSALRIVGSIVGKGMVAGIYILTAPIALVSIIAVLITGHHNSKKVKDLKERLYQEAIKKCELVNIALANEVDANQQRIEYLKELNILLHRIIEDLGSDLKHL